LAPAEQGVQVSRVDPVTLVAGWTTTVPGSDTARTRSAVVDVHHGRVSVLLGSSAAVLDGADGTLLASWSRGGGDRPERSELVLAPHGWAVTTLARVWPTSRWYGADGEPALDLR